MEDSYVLQLKNPLFHDMSLWSGKQIYIPKDSVVTKTILILQITAGTPFSDLGSNLIGTFLYKCRNIKLCLQPAGLRITYKPAVDEKLDAGTDTHKNDIVL